MELYGDGVRLRRWRPGDEAAVRAVLDDPHVIRWAALEEEGPAAWVARQRERRDRVSLAITRPPDDDALGRVGLRPDAATRTGELDYWLVPSARGAGLALAAVRTLCDWALTAGGLDAVVLRIEPGNAPSLRLARRLGAVAADEPPRPEVDRFGVERALVRFELRR